MSTEHNALHRRAQCALQASVAATQAKAAAERALQHATSGPVSTAAMAALSRAITALDKAIHLAENARQRVLRKVDRIAAITSAEETTR